MAFAHDSTDLERCGDVVRAMVTTLQSPPYASRSFQIIGVRAVDEPESLAQARAGVLRRALLRSGVASRRLEVAAGQIGSPAARLVISQNNLRSGSSASQCGVDVDEGVVGDAPTNDPHVMWVDGGGRSQQRALVALEAFERALVRRPVDAPVRFVHLLREVRFESGEARERAPGEAVALGVLHAALDLALGARSVRRTSARCELPVSTELEQRRRERRSAGRAVGVRDQAARAVAEQDLHGAAEVVKAAEIPSSHSLVCSPRNALTNTRRE